MNATRCSHGAVRSFACMRVDRSHDVPQRRGYSVYNMASILWKGCYSSWRKIRGPAGRNVQKRANTGLCLAIIGATICPPLVAFAQDITPTPQTAVPPGVTIEQVIVTGSNIPTSEEVGPQAVDTYRKVDIERLGVRSATDFVQKLPVATGPSINENINTIGGGQTEIDLRGLAAKETLVLQDGRRLAADGFAGYYNDLNAF